jgi:hypothetical protein
MNGLLSLLGILCIVALLAARRFGHKEFAQDGSRFDTHNDFVIQIDDYGSFWDPSVPARALEKIGRMSEKGNVIVIMFIHGWHHNAAANDANAKDFSSTLTTIRVKLDDNVDGKPGMYRLSREKLTGSGDVQIIGLYVGWRGKSLPMPLDYLTFWGRKAAAERVGQGDLREFLLRLNEIYRKRAEFSEGVGKRPFMGMVTFGHSFGGQVLFKAVGSAFEQELIDATSMPSISTDLSPSKHISGFGDIVVLLNPALEAYQYERIHELNGKVKYDRTQTPRLLILSAATDSARKIFFPIGRSLGALFSAPGRGDQRALWNQALGEFAPQVTHSVEIVAGEQIPSQRFDANTYTNNPCGIVNFDLTNVPFIGGVKLTPREGHIPYSPFLVASASGAVIIKHSGIFEKALRDFLNDYVAITEGKRMLLADPQMRNCPEFIP